MNPIYLDYAATTPLDPRVAARMSAWLTDPVAFGNPASLHSYGQKARAQVEEAREQAAALIGAVPSEIIWTSGATEANNLALKGVMRLYQRKGRHLITMRTEHKAVLDTCQYLEKEGYSITYLNPEPSGLLNIEALNAAIRPDTALISIMHVNNETGVIQDIQAIGQIAAEKGVLFHVDATQAIGKITVDVKRVAVDLLSFSAHKFYGPKGIGALFLRKKPRVRVEPLLHGGGHEQGMRSGTLAVHQIVGMGQACLLAQTEMHTDLQHAEKLRALFLQEMASTSHHKLRIKLNTSAKQVVPFILNVRFEGMVADALLRSWIDVAASTASACQSSQEGSHVLRAMGLTSEQVKASIRFSWGRFTRLEEMERALQYIASTGADHR